MYQPTAHQEHRIEVLHALIGSHPLGCLVNNSAAGLNVNHIPFMLCSDGSASGCLRGHVARANPVWNDLSGDCVVIFQGAQSYISPNWYPTKHQTARAVPTWNYAVVHVHGALRVIHDTAWKRQLVSDLTDIHEARQKLPWQVSDAPPDYLAQMLDMIVGIEIPLTRIEGKWKVSQNRPEGDRLGVVAGLAGEPDGLAMAELVKAALDESKGDNK